MNSPRRQTLLARLGLGRKSLLALLLMGALAFYAAVMMCFASTGLGQPRALDRATANGDGASVIIDLTDVRPINGQLVANVRLATGDHLLDPATAALTADTTVVIRTAAEPIRQSWPQGSSPTQFPATIDISGDVTHWPYDEYRTGPITAELFTSRETAAQHLPVHIVDRLRGWQVITNDTADETDAQAPQRLTLNRSPATAAFATCMIALLVLFAALAVFVASQVLRRRRRFQPAFMSWYAGMIFATISLRNALPDSPPIGWWIDVTVVLWVLLALGVSMTVYIFCWWRDDDTV